MSYSFCTIDPKQMILLHSRRPITSQNSNRSHMQHMTLYRCPMSMCVCVCVYVYLTIAKQALYIGLCLDIKGPLLTNFLPLMTYGEKTWSNNILNIPKQLSFRPSR